jgi:hypothetical protein
MFYNHIAQVAIMSLKKEGKESNFKFKKIKQIDR